MLVHMMSSEHGQYELPVESCSRVSVEHGTRFDTMEVATLQMRVVRRYRAFRVGAGNSPMRTTAHFGASAMDSWHFRDTNETLSLPREDFRRLSEWFQSNKEPLLMWVLLCPFQFEGGRMMNITPKENPL